MKFASFLFTVFFLHANILPAQEVIPTRELTPVRGHYKQLALLSGLPKSPDESIDRERFPREPSSAEKLLKLQPYYLQDLTLDDFEIPHPPANSSEQTRAELNYLLSLQKQRTHSDIEASLHMAGVFYNVGVRPSDSTYPMFRRNLFFIGRSIGPWFNPETLPLTANLMANVWRDASFFIWSMKFKYLRVRPYTLELDLENLEDANWAAYPSGHSANAYISAYLYQELSPDFTDVFVKDAYDMAHSREIIGVHYPSDSEASRIFARQFVNKLFTNPKFLSDFESVKAEWKEKANESFIRPETGKEGGGRSAACASQPQRCEK